MCTFSENVQLSAADLDLASLGSQACEERERERERERGGGGLKGSAHFALQILVGSALPTLTYLSTFTCTHYNTHELAHYTQTVFTTFVLSNFILILSYTITNKVIQLSYTLIFTHTLSSTFRLTVAVPTTTKLLSFSSWQLYSSLLINCTFPPALASHVATLVTPILDVVIWLLSMTLTFEATPIFQNQPYDGDLTEVLFVEC